MENQERLARQWAEQVMGRGELSTSVFNDGCRAAAELVLANTTPPTMEGVQWDAKKHRGLGTFGEDGVEWVMVDMRPDRRIIGVTTDFERVRALRPKWLTPNGKQYELREVGDGQPEHPTTLRTMEDYENAPGGTIVALDGGEAWFKGGSCEFPWVCRRVELRNASMANTGRVVLRWGWSE